MHPQQLLRRYQLEPKKSLGQNFLFDDRILARIAAAAELTATHQVLEIGPGLGHLTRHLAAAAGRVIAVELDGRLMPILRERLGDYENVTLLRDDILKLDVAGLFPGAPYRVVANVPYYITGAILRHLLTAPARPELLVLTVQKEVAARLTAAPDDMNLLAVSVQAYGQVELIATIKAGSFWPRPDVDSAVVRIDLRDQAPLGLDDEARFFQVVRAGFAQKRKQLRKNLRNLGWSRAAVDAALAAAGVDGRRRAETLSLPEWVRLVDELTARL